MAHPRRIEPAALFDVSLQIIDEKGFANLSVREIADRLGVKAASLYRHMESFDQLKHRVADLAAQQLREQLQLSLDRLRDGSAPARLAALAWAFVLWAEQFPARYDGLASEPTTGPGMLAVRELIAAEVSQLAGSAGDRAKKMTPRPELTSHAVLAFLHGHVMLGRCGLGVPHAGADGFERGLVALLRGL